MEKFYQATTSGKRALRNDYPALEVDNRKEVLEIIGGSLPRSPSQIQEELEGETGSSLREVKNILTDLEGLGYTTVVFEE